MAHQLLNLKNGDKKKRKWMNLASGVLMVSLGTLLTLYYKLGWHL